MSNSKEDEGPDVKHAAPHSYRAWGAWLQVSTFGGAIAQIHVETSFSTSVQF